MDECIKLTSSVLSDAAVLAVPVPEKKRCISGARKHVTISADVRLGAGQTGDDIKVAKHNLGQFT